MPVSKPPAEARASTRTTIAAAGTYGTLVAGATRPSSGPRSSGLRTASYRARTPGFAEVVETIRGAARATRSSSKWANTGPNQPGTGSQSASRKATSGVVVADSPVMRALAGPRLASWRRTVAVPATATAGRLASSTTRTSATAPAAAMVNVGSWPCTGMTTVTSSGPKRPPAGLGWAAPVSSRRSTKGWADGEGSCPAAMASSARRPAGPSRKTVSGDPPTSTRPPS